MYIKKTHIEKTCYNCGETRLLVNTMDRSGSEGTSVYCKPCSSKLTKGGRNAPLNKWLEDKGYSSDAPYTLFCECGNEQTYSTKYSLVRVLQTSGRCGECSRSMNRQHGGQGYYKRTPDIRKKSRLSNIKVIERISENGRCVPGYNPDSIQIIEKKAKELGITDLKHAQNGGEHYVKELGYWLDGYSPEKNIVIEYYEDRHRRQVEKDNQRQKEIMELYGLSEEQFIIICESKKLEKYRDSIATSDSISRNQTSP